MNILAIEASGTAGSVAYIRENRIIGEYYICHKLTHSQTIMPMLEHLKEMIGIELDSIDAIAVSSGPGSFTGLRIGVATAKAMALALNCPIIGIPTLDLIAYNMINTDKLICPIMDARRNQVYTSIYKWQQDELERMSEYDCIQIKDLLEKLKQYDKEVVFVGDGIDNFKEVITNELGDRAAFAPSFLQMQRASTLAHMAAIEYEKGNTQDANLFVPMYVRKSQAERELEEREANANQKS